MSEEPTRGRGRPAHEPNDKTRDQVQTMAGYGIPHAEIARLVGISEPTMRKHYEHELDTGATKANAMVAQTLFQKTQGNGPGAVAAAIFWLKARAGWREYPAAASDEPKPEPMGKKEAARVAAKNPEPGTPLGDLMRSRQGAIPAYEPKSFEHITGLNLKQ